MPKGKPWCRSEEKRLKEMVQKGANIEILTQAFNISPDAIRKKIERIGLKVVLQKPQKRWTTTSVLPADIITHEQALRILSSALEHLKQPGLDKLELQRLRILVDAVQTYDSVLEKFEGWVEIENRLVEMDKKIAELQKVQNVSA